MKIKIKRIIYTLLGFLAFSPILTFAATGTCDTSGGGSETLAKLCAILNFFRAVVSDLLPIFFALALVYFFWGVAQFILNDAGNDKTREEGKKKIIWSVVALFVFVSIYGILNFIGDLIDIKPGTPTVLPGASFPPETLP